MPTLIQHEPDSFDLDYFLSKYSDRYGVVSREQNITQLKLIPFAFNPSQCAPAKQLHYFHIPSQPSLTNCLCNKYYTYFTSKHHTLEISRPSTPTPNSNIPTPWILHQNNTKNFKIKFLNHQSNKIHPHYLLSHLTTILKTPQHLLQI